MTEELSISLRSQSSDRWVKHCLTHFDDFLIDHAACERKASAIGIQFIVKYPDRPTLHQPMVRMAQEELLHFREVLKIMEERGITPKPDEKNPYVNALQKEIRHGRDEGLLDRLLVVGIIEARGCERFRLMGEGLEEGPLKRFYLRLAKSEEKHHELFLQSALAFFDESTVRKRLDELLAFESRLIEEIPLRAAVH